MAFKKALACLKDVSYFNAIDDANIAETSLLNNHNNGRGMDVQGNLGANRYRDSINAHLKITLWIRNNSAAKGPISSEKLLNNWFWCSQGLRR